MAIRADEEYREGYTSTHENLRVKLPLKEAGIDKPGVLDILDGAGLGLPAYYEWRTRSGCTFCFFQQKIEWVRLMERHPGYFEEARSYEKNAIDHGSPFTWSQGESLDELARPERVAEIRAEHERRVERMRGRTAGESPEGPMLNLWILTTFMVRLSFAWRAISKFIENHRDS